MTAHCIIVSCSYNGGVDEIGVTITDSRVDGQALAWHTDALS